MTSHQYFLLRSKCNSWIDTCSHSSLQSDQKFAQENSEFAASKSPLTKLAHPRVQCMLLFCKSQRYMPHKTCILCFYHAHTWSSLPYSSSQQQRGLCRGSPFTKPACLYRGRRERERERRGREGGREGDGEREGGRERDETSLPHLAAFGLPTPEKRPCCGN